MDRIGIALLGWYEHAKRALPWRTSGTTAWGVYVSEIMAQQTQVERVAPIWTQWLQRWPNPTALAAATPADVLRAWDRLGYPRRALWMHAAAQQMVERHGGRVPRDPEALRALPGIGEYTAAAIRAFAFKQRAIVLDVNVRRVHSRIYFGNSAPSASITNAEREHHDAFLPTEAKTAATLAQAVMEFGALVCTARNPGCDDCPVRQHCAWARRGFPTPTITPRKQPKFDGTDRQCRGALMKVLRDADAPVGLSRLEAAWTDAMQRQRCIDGLVADGLVVAMSRKRFALPGDHAVS